jgi:hypothetical protein
VRIRKVLLASRGSVDLKLLKRLIPFFQADCLAAIWRLLDISMLMKSHTVSRAIHRKVRKMLLNCLRNLSIHSYEFSASCILLHNYNFLQILALLTGLSPAGQIKLLKSARAIGERALIELTSSCSNLSHYHAQQQLWAAIRARGKSPSLKFMLHF